MEPSPVREDGTHHRAPSEKGRVQGGMKIQQGQTDQRRGRCATYTARLRGPETVAF